MWLILQDTKKCFYCLNIIDVLMHALFCNYPEMLSHLGRIG